MEAGLCGQPDRSRPRIGAIHSAAGAPRDRGHLKKRLIALGLRADACERCGLREWRGDRLTMALHHINGQRDDHRLENLQLLCPNCHSQTDTFAGRRRPAASARPADGDEAGGGPSGGHGAQLDGEPATATDEQRVADRSRRLARGP